VTLTRLPFTLPLLPSTQPTQATSLETFASFKNRSADNLARRESYRHTLSERALQTYHTNRRISSNHLSPTFVGFAFSAHSHETFAGLLWLETRYLDV
jgi:hypothetical protein